MDDRVVQVNVTGVGVLAHTGLCFQGYNDTGLTFSKGAIVYIAGDEEGTPSIALADATDPAKSLAIVGMVVRDIPPGTTGTVCLSGRVTGLNTNGFDSGNIIYLSDEGQYSTGVTTNPDTTVILGSIGIVDSTDGDINLRIVVGATPLGMPTYTVAGLPSVPTISMWIFVTDEAGGAVPAFSDGTNWRRCTDRAIVT